MFILDGGCLVESLVRRFLVGLGFFGEVGLDEELGDFLFLGGEGAEVGDTLELFGGESGFGRWSVASEVAGGAGVESDEATGGELLKSCPGGFVDDLELGRAAAPVGFVEEGGDGGGASRIA